MRQDLNGCFLLVALSCLLFSLLVSSSALRPSLVSSLAPLSLEFRLRYQHPILVEPNAMPRSTLRFSKLYEREREFILRKESKERFDDCEMTNAGGCIRARKELRTERVRATQSSSDR